MNSLLSYCEDVNGKKEILRFTFQNVFYDISIVKVINDIHGGSVI